MSMMDELTPEHVIRAYCQGLFPMADPQDGRVHWYMADPRAILPLDAFHCPHSLKRRLARGDYHVTFDQAFGDVIARCATTTEGRPQTWINQPIIEVYTRLHELGVAHSVEAWSTSGKLVGGLYGVSLGGAFFGESMFSRATDASKVCLAKLVEHLRKQGYTLLDSQIANDHMKQFGQVEIDMETYLVRLEAALKLPVQWSN